MDDVRPVPDWLKKYQTLDRFSYLNPQGKRMVFDKKKDIDIELGTDVDIAHKVEIIDSYKVEEDESFIVK